MSFLRNNSVLFASTIALLAHNQIVLAQVPCPSINSVHAAALKIDVAQNDNDKYFATASTFPVIEENNIRWSIIIKNIHAKSANEALTQAKQYVRSISTQKSTEVSFSFETYNYSCEYGPSNVELIGISDHVPIKPF